MQMVERSVLVAHTPAQMFFLVDDIEHYSRFLPWCSKAEVLSREGDQVVARLYIDYLTLKQSLTTRNTNQAGGGGILMELVDGPFEHLKGGWHFTPLGECGCKVEFRLRYQLSSRILAMVIGPVFEQITGTLVEAFMKEADKVYGSD